MNPLPKSDKNARVKLVTSLTKAGGQQIFEELMIKEILLKNSQDQMLLLLFTEDWK